ncbi:protein phosphatase 4 regulatory subunit 3, partial [Phenoliferia sp. Uapishka_3]
MATNGTPTPANGSKAAPSHDTDTAVNNSSDAPALTSSPPPRPLRSASPSPDSDTTITPSESVDTAQLPSSSPVAGPSSSPPPTTTNQPPQPTTPNKSPSTRVNTLGSDGATNGQAGSAGASSSPSGSSSPTSSPGGSDDGPKPRRVKLYRLHQDSWSDLGTGMCTSEFLESTTTSTHPTSEDGAWITVKSEPATPSSNPASPSRPTTPAGESKVILRTKIMPYPAGYDSDEEDEEEIEGAEGGKEGKVKDLGGYSRQQETLIVWTDRESESDMALSFATASGCAEIWNFIRRARRLIEQPPASPSPSPSLSSPQSFPLYTMSTQLQEPSLGNIELIETTIRALGRTAVGRERMASTILRGQFVKKLIAIHGEAEDLESLGDLHALCRVMQTILLLNDNGIFELVLRDDVILGVASILEYDPEFPTMKASYRSHLADPSHFTLVVPIRSSSLLAKIHQTHRLHYLKDVVLARVLEDSTFSMLNSAIYFNEVDIVNEVATDPVLLKELFAIFDEEDPGETKLEGTVSTPPIQSSTSNPSIGPQLPPEIAKSLGLLPSSPTLPSMQVDPSPTSSPPPGPPPPPPSDKKHDAILFLQQLCSMAKNLQLPLRSAFFRSLADRGLLRVIEVALSRTVTREDPVMRAATVEILMILVDLDPNNVRGYSLKQQNKGKRPLAVFLIELFQGEEDLGLKAQMAEALRVLVDAGGDGGPLEAPPRMRQEDPEAEKFLQYFYDECIAMLLAPISAISTPPASGPSLELPLQTVALLGHLCDLLCFFVSHHTFRSKYFVLSTAIAQDTSKLFATRHKHLQLAALRFFRACVGRGDDFYNRFLIKNDLFRPILEIVGRERDRDNLVSSACLEFFEFIRGTNVKAVINHLMDRYGDKVRQLALTLKTFEMLIAKWEQNNEPPPKPAEVSSTATSKSMTRESRSWARMDVEEDNYFNGSDEEEDSTAAGGSAGKPGSRKREADDSDGDRKRLRLDQAPSSLPRSKTWPEVSSDTKGKGKGLVDYGDDSDEEDSTTSAAGGFVKEDATTASAESGEKEGKNGETKEGEKKDAESISLPPIDTGEGPPPIPPRRKEVDEEDQLGLLSAKRKLGTPVGVTRPTLGVPKAASTPAATTKFKLSFGVKNLAKLAGGVEPLEKKDGEGEKSE